MISLRHPSLTIAAIASIVVGCTRESLAPFQVTSVGEILPTLEGAASRWADDAYLEELEMPLPGPSWQTRIASAGFRSPSMENDILMLWIDRDGLVHSENLVLPGPGHPAEAIGDEDWRLDAPEALELALNDEGRAVLEGDAEANCSYMQLRREMRLPGHPVVWRLVVRRCPLGDAIQDTTVDATTGEILVP
jgi:hypothetical protein